MTLYNFLEAKVEIPKKVKSEINKGKRLPSLKRYMEGVRGIAKIIKLLNSKLGIGLKSKDFELVRPVPLKQLHQSSNIVS